MSDLERLVKQWRTKWLLEEETVPEDICRERPELLPEFRRRIGEIILIDDLVGEFEELRAAGQEPSPETICRGQPELLDRFKAEIAKLSLFDSAFGDVSESDSSDIDSIREISHGRYEGICRHRVGGQGIVYKATDKELNRLVAVKGPRGRRWLGLESLNALETEAKTIGKLEHPGIVPVYGFGHDKSDTPYYAMKFIDGESFKLAIASFHQQSPAGDKLSRHNVEFQNLLRNFISVCQTIAFAHSKHVAHCDIKPQNIMLGRFGEVWVIDWGLAKLTTQPANQLGDVTDHPVQLDATPRCAWQPQVGPVQGTPEYMSPEQAKGRHGDVGPPSDIYGLGATLYELLTGKPPVKASISTGPAAGGKIVSPRDVAIGIPRPLDAVCMKAISIEPEDRYAGAASLADDIANWLADERVTAYSESPWSLSRRWLRRHRAVAVSATIVLLLAMVSLLATNVLQANFNKELQAEIVKTRRSLYRSNVALAESNLANGNAPRAQQLLNDAPPEFRQWEWRYLDRLTHPWLASVTLASPKRDPDFENIELLGTFQTKLIPMLARFQAREPFAMAWCKGTGHFLTSTKGHVQEWDSDTGRKVNERELQNVELCRESISSDGTHEAVQTEGASEIAVYETHSGKRVSTIPVGSHVWGPSFILSHNGTYVALIEDNSDQVLIRSVETGREVSRVKDQLDSSASVQKVFFSDDSKWLVIIRNHSGSFTKGSIAVYDVETAKRVFSISPKGEYRNVASISQDGQLIAFGGAGISTQERSIIRVWNVPTNSEVAVLFGHSEPVTSLAFDHDGGRIASGSADRSVRIWELKTGHPLSVFRAHRDLVNYLSFNEDNRRLLSSSGLEVRILPATLVRSSVVPMEDVVSGITFLPDGRKFAVHAGNGVRIWDATAGAEIHAHYVDDHVVMSAASPDGSLVASVNNAEIGIHVLIHDRTGRLVETLPEPEEPIRQLEFSANSEKLAYVTQKYIQIWDVRTHQAILRLDGENFDLFCMSFSTDGRRIVGGGTDGQVRVWDCHSGKLIASWTAQKDGLISAVAFSPHGTLLAVGEIEHGNLTIWDLSTATSVATLSGHTRGISCIAFSTDAQRIATGSYDASVKLWDTSTWNEVLTLQGHDNPIRALAFNADNSFLISAASQGSWIVSSFRWRKPAEIRIWDARAIGDPAADDPAADHSKSSN